MNKIRYNKSKTYLLPLLSDCIYLEKKYYKYLKNTYILDNLDLYNKSIYLMHDYDKMNNSIDNYEQNIIDNIYFHDLIQDKNKVIYVMKFPKKYINEYNLFLEGKYSHFSEEAKNVILSYYTELYAGNVNAINFLIKVKQILYKDEKLRKQIEDELGVHIDSNAELTDVIDLKYETINLQKIIKNKEIEIYSDKNEVDNVLNKKEE
jgi:hypothetical protein